MIEGLNKIADLPNDVTLNIEIEDGEFNAVVLTDTEQGDVYLSAKEVWAIANAVNWNRELRKLIS